MILGHATVTTSWKGGDSRYMAVLMGLRDTYLLWLRVGISNHDRRWILAYYLEAIEELSAMNLAGEGIFPGTCY